MRIAFTGSHSTGKSTLLLECLDIALMGDSIPIFDGIVRQWDGIKKLSPRGQQRLIDYWYVWNHYKTSSFISSRTIFDTWAYAQLSVHADFHLNLFHWAVKHIWYDYLFYLPVEFELEEDGVRPEGREFQLQHDRRLKLILDYHQVPYHTLTGTVLERTQQIRNVLDYHD